MKSKILKWCTIIFILLVILLLLFGVGYRIYNTYKIKHLFDNEDPFSQDKRILVDSIKFNDTIKLYWFTFDSGVFGHSSDFLSLTANRKLVSKSNAFFYSNSLSSIKKIGNDSILIKLGVLDFHIDSTKINIPFRIELNSEGIPIPPSKRLNIPIE